jgi:Mn-dependent DtxR family transcriptional regulator
LSDVSELEERASFPLTLHESFTQYLKQRMITLDGRKVIYIRMKDLAKRLSTSRLAVSQHLNQLQSQGVLALGRKVIEIKEFRSILTL